MAKRDKRPLTATPAGWTNPFAGLEGGGGGQEEAREEGEAGVGEAERPRSARAAYGRVVLRRETAHRGGKAVIVVDDFPPQISAAQIAELSRQLKKACGSGGTVKDRAIEIQGDQAGKIRSLLEAAGFRVAGLGR